MALDPDIQKHFDYKYVEGELHMFVSKDLVESLGWTEKELDMSFGGIKRMNSFKDAHLTLPSYDVDMCVVTRNVFLYHRTRLNYPAMV